MPHGYGIPFLTRLTNHRVSFTAHPTASHMHTHTHSCTRTLAKLGTCLQGEGGFVGAESDRRLRSFLFALSMNLVYPAQGLWPGSAGGSLLRDSLAHLDFQNPSCFLLGRRPAHPFSRKWILCLGLLQPSTHSSLEASTADVAAASWLYRPD